MVSPWPSRLDDASAPADGILTSSIGKQQMTNNVLTDVLPLIALGICALAIIAALGLAG